MNIKWNAKEYTSDFNYVAEYGKGVSDLITAPAGSTVIDLGCGSGTLTRVLADRGYRVAGIDSSRELIDFARKRFPDLTFIEADATNFTVDSPVDVIFSNAVFHWIDAAYQDSMLASVSKALRSGGQLVCEFGGHGNNELIHAALMHAFGRRGLTYKMPFYFPTIGEYAPIIERHGMVVTFASLFDRPTELKGDDGMAEWIRTFVKVPFAGVSADDKASIIGEAVDELRPKLYHDGKWYADYVRIRIKAEKQSRQ